MVRPRCRLLVRIESSKIIPNRIKHNQKVNALLLSNLDAGAAQMLRIRQTVMVRIVYGPPSPAMRVVGYPESATLCLFDLRMSFEEFQEKCELIPMVLPQQ